MSELTNELNYVLNWEVVTAKMVYSNNIPFETFETVKPNKTNVLRLIDDIKIDCGVILEIIAFDNEKRIFLVNSEATSEGEKYKFLFSSQKYSELFLLLKGFIIGLGN